MVDHYYFQLMHLPAIVVWTDDVDANLLRAFSETALFFSVDVIVDGLGVLPTSGVCSAGDSALSTFGIGLASSSSPFVTGAGDETASVLIPPDRGVSVKSKVKIKKL